MTIQWANIRLPIDLHRRIQKIANERDRSGAHNLRQPPDNFRDRGTPLHFIIELAMKDFESHRQRSSYAVKKDSRRKRLKKQFYGDSTPKGLLTSGGETKRL